MRLMRTVPLHGATAAEAEKQFLNLWGFSFGPFLKLSSATGNSLVEPLLRSQ